MGETAGREKVATTSGGVVEAQEAKLRSVFPEVFVEGKIDFDRLRAILGGGVESGPNRFTSTWSGKDDSLAFLQTPSRGTLVPDPGESVNFSATGNVFIEGDNLEVLKLLFKPYFGWVKLIYIDAPYNTGQDFVYRTQFLKYRAKLFTFPGHDRSRGTTTTRSTRSRSSRTTARRATGCSRKTGPPNSWSSSAFA